MTTSKKQTEFNPNLWAELKSVEQFYYLGFLMADGCVYHNSITVDLAIKDYTWLINYKRNLGITSKINIRDQNPNRNSISASVRVTNKQWMEDLSGYNLVPQKTGHETLPYDFCRSIKDVAALTLGFIDGDGSIYKKSTDKYYLNVLGNKHIVTQVINMLEQYVGVESNKLVKDNRTENIYSVSFGAKEDLMRIYNFLYKTNPELAPCWLDRKFSKFSAFVLDKCVDTYVIAEGVCA